MDGLAAYVGAFRRALRTRVTSGQRGRPRLVLWPQVVLGQVIKRYERRRVVEVVRQVALGTLAQAQGLLTQTQGQGVLNIVPLAGVVDEIDTAITELHPPAKRSDRGLRAAR